jgi:hypothetical protein
LIFKDGTNQGHDEGVVDTIRTRGKARWKNDVSLMENGAISFVRQRAKSQNYPDGNAFETHN